MKPSSTDFSVQTFPVRDVTVVGSSRKNKHDWSMELRVHPAVLFIEALRKDWSAVERTLWLSDIDQSPPLSPEASTPPH